VKSPTASSSSSAKGRNRSFVSTLAENVVPLLLLVVLVVLLLIYLLSAFNSQQEHQQLTERMNEVLGNNNNDTPPTKTMESSSEGQKAKGGGEKGANNNKPTSEGDAATDVELKDVKLVVGARALHLVLAGPSDAKIAFLLVHGGSKQNQDAAHWKPHAQFFSELGLYCAVDLLGHGNSVPGKESSLRVTVGENLKALHTVMEETLKGKQVIVVARSAGGVYGFNLAKRYPSQVKGLVLIAPGYQEEQLGQLPTAVINMPTLLFWSQNDQVMPFHRSEMLLQTLRSSRLISYERVTTEKDPTWIEHVPEIVMVNDFQKQVRQWLGSLQL